MRVHLERLSSRVGPEIIRPAALMVSRGGGAVAGLAVSLVMARTMDVDQMAEAVAAMALAMMLATAATLSMDAAAPRFITQDLASGKTNRARGFTSLSFRLLAAMSGLAVFIACALLWAGAPLPYALALFAAPATGTVRLVAAHGLSFGNVITSQIPATLMRPAALALLLLAIAAIVQPTATMVMGAFIASTAAAAAATLWLQRRHYAALTAPPDRAGWWPWLRTGLLIGPNLLSSTYSREVLLLIAAVVLTDGDLVLLSVVTAVVALARFSNVAVNQSITPALSRALGADDRGGVTRILARAVWLRLAAALLCTVAFAVGGPLVPIAFGPNFVGATPLLLIFAIELWAIALLGPAEQVMALNGRERALIPFALANVAATVIGVAVGAALAGLTGAVIGIVICRIARLAALTLYVWRRDGLDVSARALWARGDRAQAAVSEGPDCGDAA